MELSFNGFETIIQQDLINTDSPKGGKIPIVLYARKDEAEPDIIYFEAEIDGVSWFITESITHANILYTMLKKHVNEYMRYEKL